MTPTLKHGGAESGQRSRKDNSAVNFCKFLALSECYSSNLRLCGGKAASLGELMSLGCNVPDGFVVTTQAPLELDALDRNRILQMFDALGGQPVAVRSSGVQEDSLDRSWAGQFDTILGVSREGLVEAIQSCRRSQGSQHASEYADFCGEVTGSGPIAVVVQKMVQSTVSGVMFTADPVEGTDRILIEAVYGLGESLVSGKATPQRLYLDRYTGEVLSNVPHRQKAVLDGQNHERAIRPEERRSNPLSAPHNLQKLWEVTAKLEKHFGRSQDIEWALADDELFILQSRPITTLTPGASAAPPRFLGNCTTYITRPAVLQRDEVFRMTANSIVPISVATIPAGGSHRTYCFESQQAGALFSRCLEMLGTWEGWKCHLERYETLVRTADELCGFMAGDPKAYRPILDRYRAFLKTLAPYLFTGVAVDNVVFPEFRRRIMAIWPDRPDVQSQVLKLVAAPIRFHDFQPLRLSICRAALEGSAPKQSLLHDIVRDYAHVNQYMFTEPLLTVEQLHHEIRTLDRERARLEVAAIESSLEQDPNWDVRLAEAVPSDELVRWGHAIKTYAWLRTDRIDRLRRVHLQLRRVFEGLAGDLGAASGCEWTCAHVVNLSNHELDQFVDLGIVPDFSEVTARMDGAYVYYFHAGASTVVTEPRLVQTLTGVVKSSGTGTQDSSISPGTTAYEGYAQGHVKRIFSKNDLQRVESGDIMVAFVTMPDYTPQMRIAGGVITADGGITSHAAIVSRELHKPAIVGSSNCMDVLQDGDEVLLDSVNQRVTVVRAAKPKKAAEPQRFEPIAPWELKTA